MFDLKLTEDQLEKLKSELTGSGLFDFYKEWVFIKNDFSYCDYHGRDRVMQSKEKEEKSIPVEVSEYFKGLKTSYEGVNNPLLNPKSINNNNKPSNKGSTYSSLENITPEIIKDISDYYHVPSNAVQQLKERMELYCASSGKTYKNYKSALMQWTLRRIEEGKIKTLQVHSSPIKEMLKKAGRNDIDF